jgi:thioredoxin 1
MKPRNLILTAALLILSAVNALAADRFVYESKKFQDELAAGKPILVHVTAPWCGKSLSSRRWPKSLITRP